LGTLRLLVDAANAGDPERVKAFLTGTPAAVDATARMLALSSSLHCRLEKKFGRVPLAQAFDDLGHSLDLEVSYLERPITQDPGGTVATAGDYERLVRTPATGGAWKLDADALFPKNMPPAAIAARLAQFEAAAHIADDAEAGKIRSAPDAAAAVVKALNTSR
jgi:hypothetical protein